VRYEGCSVLGEGVWGGGGREVGREGEYVVRGEVWGEVSEVINNETS